MMLAVGLLITLPLCASGVVLVSFVSGVSVSGLSSWRGAPPPPDGMMASMAGKYTFNKIF
jgi:hypothetical protein